MILRATGPHRRSGTWLHPGCRPLRVAGRGSGFLRELCRARLPEQVSGPPRFVDEPLRRQLLDAAALLSLLEAPLLGDLMLQRADSGLLIDLLRALQADDAACAPVHGWPSGALAVLARLPCRSHFRTG